MDSKSLRLTEESFIRADATKKGERTILDITVGNKFRCTYTTMAEASFWETCSRNHEIGAASEKTANGKRNNGQRQQRHSSSP